ncbi:MAG: YihY/virulence factor BrkB family protein [Actinomycetota bacterium]|nr:YihY/virulence factor BrkB family protein [Actinomycetota bacterium]
MAESSWSTHPKVLTVRRRSAPANTVVKAIEAFRVHRTGRNAALVAHYGFMSVFPLMLVFTTVLGFVLQNRPRLRETIIDSAFARIPIIGQQIATEPERIKGNVLILVVGLLVTLWAGLRAFNALQTALDDIAEVPQDDRPSLLRTRARSMLGIAVVGGSQIGAAILTSFVGVTGVRVLHKVLLSLAAVAVNAVVLAASYRWLCMKRQSWRQVAPGAVVAGVIFAGLQLTGTAVVGRAIAKASPVYGTFASVIGLITWLSLHSMVALLGAEMNHVLPARRYTAPLPDPAEC